MIRARVEELKATAAGVIMRKISSRNARMQVLQDLFDRMNNLIEARAQDPTMAAVPGGSTGLLVRDYQGKNRNVPTYRVDFALLSEQRALLRHAAEETGEWREKKEEPKVDLVAILEAGRRRANAAKDDVPPRAERVV
jgi:hypothetical protein